MSVQETKVDEIDLFLAERSSSDPDLKSPRGTILIMETVQTTGSQTKVLDQRWEWNGAPIGEQSGQYVWGRLNGVPFIVCENEFRTVTMFNLTRWKAGIPRPPFVRGLRPATRSSATPSAPLATMKSPSSGS